MSHPYAIPVPPVVLCRCVGCCCKPGEGHNDPRWIAYEAALDELEAAYSDGHGVSRPAGGS